MFYSFDADSSGEIDQEELGVCMENRTRKHPHYSDWAGASILAEGALESLGFPLSAEEIEVLFSKYEKGGAIDLDGFQLLVKQLGIRPEPGLGYAMALFAKYDEDKSGAIDKIEFKQIAREIQENNQRRTILAGAAAAVGALVVAKYDVEYALAQKLLRFTYVEPLAENSMSRYFPTGEAGVG
jgi:Ca2+-binding EF-hand superfamily protein